MQPTKHRVVLDTNQVICAGTGWMTNGRPCPDANVSRRVLICVVEKHHGLYCGKIVGEYLEKLVDLGHPSDRAMKMMTYLMGAFTRVAVTTKTAPVRPSDLDDEIFLLCALDGQADFLVSDDHSLLNIRSSYSPLRIGQPAEIEPHLNT